MAKSCGDDVGGSDEMTCGTYTDISPSAETSEPKNSGVKCLQVAGWRVMTSFRGHDFYRVDTGVEIIDY